MGKLKIYINGSEIDLGDAEKLNIANSYAIADINDIDARKNSTTKEIKVPASAKNRAIFGFAEDINSIEAINQKTQYYGLMEFEGVEIIRGLVKFIKPLIGSSTDYYFTIVGESGDWRNKLDKRSLYDIDLTDQEHRYAKDVINTAETVGAGRIYSYPVIDNGRLGVYNVFTVWSLSAINALVFDQEPTNLGDPPYPIDNMVGEEIVLSGFGFTEDIVTTVISQYDSNSSNGIIVGVDPDIDFNGSQGIFYLRNGSNNVRVTDRVPAIQIKGLTDRIFKEAGYRVVSNWLNNEGRKLWMLKQRSNNSEYSEEYYDQYKFKAIITGNQNILHTQTPDFLIIATIYSGGILAPPTLQTQKYFKVKFNTTEFDAGQLYNTTDSYFSPTENGVYRFTFEGKVTGTPIGNFQMVLLKANQTLGTNIYGGTTGIEIIPGFALQNTTEPAFDFDVEFTTGYINVNVGQKVYLAIRNVQGQNNDFIIKANGVFNNELYEKKFKYGSTVNLQRFMPDISQLDFIRGLKQVANLYFLTDVGRGIVYIEPRDLFFSDNVMDWSGKIDLSKEMEINEIGTDMEKRQLLAYRKDAEDIVVENREVVTGYRLASREVKIDNIFVEDSLAENENEIFCPTVMEVLSQAPAVDFTTTEVPTMRNGEAKITFDTRLLYYEGVPTALGAGESWRFENDVRSTFPRFYSVDKKRENYNSLYFDSFPNCVGLVDKHYGGLFNEINNGRMLTAYFNLKATDIQGFVNIDAQKRDYRAKIFMNFQREGGYYRINKIHDFDPMDGKTTKVDLIKVVDSSPLPAYNIPYLILIQVTALDTVAGGTVRVCVKVRNVGAVDGIAQLVILLPWETPAYDAPYTFTAQSTNEVCFNLDVPANIPSGSYQGTLEGTLHGDFEFFVSGCDTPANVVVNDFSTQPAELAAGSGANLIFDIENIGCYAAAGSQTISLYNFLTGTLIAQYFIPSLVLEGLDTAIVNGIFTNLPAGTGPDFLINVVAAGVFNYEGTIYVPAVNPAAGPFIVVKTPLDDATGVNAATAIRMEFNEAVTVGAGNFKIHRASDNVAVATVAASAMTVINATTLQYNITGLAESTAYYIKITAGNFVKNAANIFFAGIDNVTEWNFTTGAFLSLQVPNTKRVIGWTMKTGAQGGAFSAVRNAAAADTFSGSSNPPILLTMQKSSNNQYILRRGHAYFNTASILPAGAILQQCILRVSRTLSSNIDAACGIMKATTNTLNAAAYSLYSATTVANLPLDVNGTVDYIINNSDVNLAGWSNFAVLFKADFLNNPGEIPAGEQYYFSGNVNLILKYTI